MANKMIFIAFLFAKLNNAFNPNAANKEIKNKKYHAICIISNTFPDWIKNRGTKIEISAITRILKAKSEGDLRFLKISKGNNNKPINRVPIFPNKNTRKEYNSISTMPRITESLE